MREIGLLGGGGIALLSAFIVVLLAGPWMLKRLTILKFGQNINTDAPDIHQKKQGTPTMGGMLIIVGVVVGILVAGALSHQMIAAPLVAVTLVFLGNFIIGFLDDYLSIKRGKNLGLKAREKLAGQFAIAALFALWLKAFAPAFTTIIYFNHNEFNLGDFYYILVVLWIVGISNATNLTDGLDGLLSGLSAIAALGLALTVRYLGANIQLPWFGYAMIGACLGFYWFNAHPAKVFMGDTGSLAIGAGFAAMAIVGKQEILLLIFSVVFLAEMFSVMMQVSYFKATKGKRIFKMSPIHHHFELSGWPETVVVARFWLFGIIALVLGLMAAPYFTPYYMGLQ